MDARLVAHVLREARPGSGERVLVAVMNNARDLEIARTEGWYRIPVKRAPRQVGADYLAFYLTGRFPPTQRHRVTYYAPIYAYRLARRIELAHPAQMPREVMTEAFQKGLMLLTCGPNGIRLVPPLVVDRHQCQIALEILDDVIGKVEKRHKIG